MDCFLCNVCMVWWLWYGPRPEIKVNWIELKSCLHIFIILILARPNTAIWQRCLIAGQKLIFNPRPCFAYGRVSYVAFVCPSVSLCMCLLTKYLKTDQLHFWWRPFLWPREETIQFKKNHPEEGWVYMVQNLALYDKRQKKFFWVAVTPKRWEIDM